MEHQYSWSPPPRDCMPSMIFVLHVCVMVCTIFGSITNAVYVQVFSIVQHRTISAELAAPALQLPHGGQKKHFQQMNVVFSVNACGLAAEAMHCVVAFMGPEHIFYTDPYIVLGSGALPFQADPARPLTHLSLLAFPRLLNPLIFVLRALIPLTPLAPLTSLSPVRYFPCQISLTSQPVHLSERSQSSQPSHLLQPSLACQPSHCSEPSQPCLSLHLSQCCHTRCTASQNKADTDGQCHGDAMNVITICCALFLCQTSYSGLHDIPVTGPCLMNVKSLKERWSILRIAPL